MVDVSDGFGSYIQREDGKMEYVPPTKMDINGVPFFKYNQDEGILTMNITQGDLEKMVSTLGDALKDGVKIMIPVPGIGIPISFPLVKKLENMPEEKSIFSLSSSGRINPQQ